MAIPRWKLVVFSLLPAVVLACLVEGVSQFVWYSLEQRALGKIEAGGARVLANDAINFLKDPDSILGYRLKRNLNFSSAATTAEGFFQREPVFVERTTGSLRIMTIGESTTQGHHVDIGSYPTFLRQTLKAKASDYPGGTEVINAGVAGWVSDQWALWSINELWQFRPDILILYPGWNDFQSYSPYSPPPEESYFEKYYGNSEPYIRAPSLKSVVLAEMLLDRFTRSTGGLTSAASGSDDLQQIHARYRFFIRNLDRTIDAFRRVKPDVTIVISTLVGRWPHDTFEQFESRNGHIWWMGDPPGDKRMEAAHLLERFNDLIREYVRSRGYMLVDNAKAFENLDRSKLQSDFAHFTADGYRILALNFYESLRKGGHVRGEAATDVEDLIERYKIPNVRK